MCQETSGVQVYCGGEKTQIGKTKKKRTREEEGVEAIDASVRHGVGRWSGRSLGALASV